METSRSQGFGERIGAEEQTTKCEFGIVGKELYLFKLFPQLRSGALGCAVLQVEDYILDNVCEQKHTKRITDGGGRQVMGKTRTHILQHNPHEDP
jgi:hypothetical protein